MPVSVRPSQTGNGAGGTQKTSALAAVSLSEQEHPRFLKIQISGLDAKSVCIVVQRIARSGSEIRSDVLGAFRAALREEYVHHYQVFGKDTGALRWVHIPI